MPGPYFFLKRVLDFLVSAVALVALLPFFALVALLLVLDSPGPVFYRQARLTQDAKAFWLIKFRSMVPNARTIQFRQGIPPHKLVTHFGKFLRRTHFDEFPQLFNVLLGEMSLVGPRPLMPKWVKEHKARNAPAMERFKVEAGMAGLERLLFLLQDDRETLAVFFPDLKPFIGSRNLAYLDAYYVENVCLSLDARIFFLTFYMSLRRLFGREG